MREPDSKIKSYGCVYDRIWKLAMPFYKHGRIYDLDQIEWMMQHGDRLAEAVGADKMLLLPLILLHDVGYSAVDDKNPNIKDSNTKAVHMREGAHIAKSILEEVGYDRNLTERIAYFISVHDNWALGGDSPYRECVEMALFTDLRIIEFHRIDL
jgi:hypothetical protein